MSSLYFQLDLNYWLWIKPCCAHKVATNLRRRLLTPKSAQKESHPSKLHETWKKSHLWDMNQDESGDSTPWHPCWSQITWVKQRPKGSHGPLGATVTSGGRPWWGAPRRRRRSVRSHVGMEEVSNGGLLWVSRSRAQSLKGRLVVATRKTGFFNSHVVRGGEDF